MHEWCRVNIPPSACRPFSPSTQAHLLVALQQSGVGIHQPLPRLTQLGRRRRGIRLALRCLRSQAGLGVGQHLVLNGGEIGELVPLAGLLRAEAEQRRQRQARMGTLHGWSCGWSTGQAPSIKKQMRSEHRAGTPTRN